MIRHRQPVRPPVGTLVGAVIVEDQRLQQVPAAIVELDLAHLEDLLVDPGNLPGVPRVLVARQALHHVAGQVVAGLRA